MVFIMMNEIELRRRLLLSIQRALLDKIPCSLRGVTIGWVKTEIIINCFFDGEISDTYRELMEVAATEVIADFSSPFTISLECFRKDAPEKLFPYTLKESAYIRYENTS